MKRALFPLVLLCLSVPSFGQQLWSGIIAPSRAVDWSHAGVAGGIPSIAWTQCGSTIAAYGSSSSPASPSTINNAVAACEPNTYLQLGAGTFYLNSGLLVNSHNNLEIRGMGANSTLLVFSGSNGCQGVYAVICFQSSDTNWKNGISNGPVNWTAGYSQGTTTITLASVPNLKVGNPIILDQEDDACASGCPGTSLSADVGSDFVCSDSTIGCSLQDNLGGSQRTHRNQVQIVTVAGCGGVTTPGSTCSGTNVSVTISPGLYMPNWSSSHSPQAWWAMDPIENVGVQNLSIDLTNAGYSQGMGVGVEFFNALNGWVQGIRSVDGSRAHVQAQYSARITVRNNYFWLTQFSTSTSYGFECLTGSDELIENNITQDVSGPWTINGACSGTVVGYNYSILDYYTSSAGYINAMSNVHTAGTDNILYEGNIGAQVYGDVFHGTHNFVTLFRNDLAGNLPACWLSGSTYATSIFGPCTNNQTPIQLYAFTRFFNIIGNVLGQTGVQNTYQSTGVSKDIIDLGYSNGLSGGNDPHVAASLLRWGNYDSVTGAVRWCGNSSDTGWSTTCGNTAEVPTSYSFFPNSVPTLGDTDAGQGTLPKSFYYSSIPTWWPSGKAWPLIGPDVSDGNIIGSGGFANSNPAEDCFLNVMGGPAAGTGSVMSFSAAACYSSSGPNPPSGLSAVVSP
jgi:hypothetical protein